MAWRFVRPWRTRPRQVVRILIMAGGSAELYPLRVRTTIVNDVLDRTTRGRFPCAGRDDARMLAEVLAWPAVGPRLGQRREGR
jgi:hypothetical protein